MKKIEREKQEKKEITDIICVTKKKSLFRDGTQRKLPRHEETLITDSLSSTKKKYNLICQSNSKLFCVSLQGLFKSEFVVN